MKKGTTMVHFQAFACGESREAALGAVSGQRSAFSGQDSGQRSAISDQEKQMQGTGRRAQGEQTGRYSLRRDDDDDSGRTTEDLAE
jgi:hypothetical protein